MADLGNILTKNALHREESLSGRDLAQGAETILTASLGRLSDATDMRKFLEYVFEEILRVTGATNASATRFNKFTNHLQLELFVDGDGPRWGMSAEEIALWASPYDADTTPSFGIGRQSRRVFAASLLKDQTEIDLEDFALPGGLEYIATNGISDAAFSVLTVGEEPVGTFHLHFTGGRVLRPEDLPVLQGLSQQAAVALRFVFLSEEAERGAIARERELLAQRRSAELVQTNEALSECIRSLKDIEDIEGFLHSVLIVAERVSGSVGAAAFIHGSDRRLYMRAYVEGGEPFSIATDPRMAVWRDEVEWTDGFSQIWRDICGSRGYWISPSNDPKVSKKYHEWHRQRGHAITLCLPLAQGDQFLGFLGLAFATHVELDQTRLELTRSLAQQTTLAVEANRLAQEAKQAAVARERELEAQSRAAEANRISSFMAATLGQMSEDVDLKLTIETIVAGLGKELGAAHIFLFRHDSATRLICLELSLIEGQIRRGLSGEEVPLFATPFRDDITPAWQIMAERRGLFTPDMAPIPAEEFAWPGAFQYAERFDLSDMAHVVLFAGDDPVGSLGFGLNDGRKLTPADKPFIEGVAKQAALAIRMLDLSEQAKQRAVADTQIRAEHARAEELARANAILRSSVEAASTSANTQQLLEHFLLQAIEATGARGGSITLFEDGRYKDQSCVAEYGQIVPEAQWRTEPFFQEARSAFSANVTSFLETLMAERITPVRVADLWSWWPTSAEYHERHGNVEIFNVPCIARGQVIASFGLGFAVVPELHSVESMLIALAQQAALALELHRLSAESKKQAILYEQEKAAQERAAELAKANDALRRSISRLVQAADVDAALMEAVQTAAEVVDADGGALGLFVPEEQGFRTLFMLVDGQVMKMDALAFASRLYSLDERPLCLAWNEFKNGNDVLWCDLESEFLAEDSKQFLRDRDLRSSVLVALKRGSECIGYLGLSSRSNTDLALGQRELLRAIADQLCLMLELSRLARASEDAAVAREQEQAARNRANELARANEALRRGVERISEDNRTSTIVANFLAEALAAVHAAGGAVMMRLLDTQSTFRVGAVHEDRPIPQDEIYASPYLSQYIELSASDPGGIFTALARGDCPAIRVEALQEVFPEAYRYHQERGHQMIWHAPLRLRGDLIGFTGVAFNDDKLPSESNQETIAALGQQLVLAMELTRLADEAKDVAIAREQEIAAHEREHALLRTNQSLELSNRLLGVVAEISTQFAQSRDFETSLISGLRMIGRAAGLGRVLLLEERARNDGSESTDHHVVAEWCAEGIVSHRDVGLEVMETNAAELLMASLRNGNALWYRISDLSDEFRNIIRPLEVMAMGCAPVYIDNRYWGTIAFDNCKDDEPWDEAIVHALTAAANAIAGALQTDKDDRRLAFEKERAVKERENAAKVRADELAAANQTITASFQRIATQSDTSSAPTVFLSDIAKAASAELCYWLDYDAETDQMALSLRCRDGVIIQRPEPDEPEIFSSPFPASLMAQWFQSPVDDRLTVLSIERDTDRLWPETAEWHKRAGRKGVLCFAVALGDRPIGVLGMAFRQETNWTPAEKELIRALASHLALSVHLCRLSEQATHWAALEERTRLAREIHDTLAQSFSGILVQLRAMEQSAESGDEAARTSHFDNALELAATGLTEARRSLASLRLRELEGRSFREALTLMAQSATKRAGIPIRVLAGVDIELGLDNEAELLRIAQESVTNAIKHSGASQITIALRHGAETIGLCIEDNGKGFDPRTTTEGFGLLGMEERAARIGATMTIESSTSGTSVCVHLKRSGRYAGL